jgi:uncharacterized UBP type Zn finger protein
LVPAADAFLDTNRQQDGQEWVIALIEAIEKELPVDQKKEWKSLFEIDIGGTYKCTANHLQPKMTQVFSMVQLAIINKLTSKELLTIEQALNNEFNMEKMDKNCNEKGCVAVKTTSSSRITSHPKLLIIHYKRYIWDGTKATKIKHSVSSNIILNIYGIHYELVGLMQHLGEDWETGHYISVTR